MRNEPGGGLGSAIWGLTGSPSAHRVDHRGEHEELPSSPSPLGFREHAAQQIDIALRVEDDHHLTATDVLGDEHFCQACLADQNDREVERLEAAIAPKAGAGRNATAKPQT